MMRGRSVLALDRGLRAVDEPVSHSRFAGMGKQAGLGRDSSLADTVWPDKVVGGIVIIVRDILHYVVPDRSCAGDTDDSIVHGRVVAIANPDAHGHVGRVAHGPVIDEAV